MMNIDIDSTWIWFIIAGILLIIEMLTFATYALWIAIGAIITGLVSLMFTNLDIYTQVFIFAFASILGLYLGYRLFNSNKIRTTDDNLLNQRGNQYINQVYTLEDDIVNGRGHLKISDTIWQIESEQDVVSTSKVRVLAVRGNKLVVEKVD